MVPLSTSISAMRQAGIRRLLILSGEASWCRAQAQHLCRGLEDKTLWVGGEGTEGNKHIDSVQVRTLLGQETDHVVFDATDGLHAEALAIVAGAMRAGSWLLLLVPSWHVWPSWPDNDSLRWHDTQRAIAAPYFVSHLKRCCEIQPDILVWQQGSEEKKWSVLAEYAPWVPPVGRPTAQQQQILQAILSQREQVAVVTGARGRGKSTLAGMLAMRLPGRCLVTGPNRSAAEVLCRVVNGDIPFFAPDALLAQCRQQALHAQWLLIDEAAAIPAPLLKALSQYFPRILMTTTVQGYEGTGRGFLLKVCAELSSYRHYALDLPVRWADGDPLEHWLNTVLLFDDAREPVFDETGELSWQLLTQTMWQKQPSVMHDFYTLLTSAHYRTTPLDLRRLMDATGNTLHAGFYQEKLVAALWLVDEGGLTPAMAQAVWAGKRRPKGNLVAQSLAAHGGEAIAAQLRSRRVSRIAVFPSQRRKGIARHLLDRALQQARDAGLDYVSVSFGYTSDLWRFWQTCGFQLVRFGTSHEASSGCYTAMAMIPLSAVAKTLCERLVVRLQRDALFITQQTGVLLPVTIIADQTFNQADVDELNGFAFATRPLETAQYALKRYLATYPDSPPVLHDVAQQGLYAPGLAARYGQTGRKALLAYCRRVLGEHLLRKYPWLQPF